MFVRRSTLCLLLAVALLPWGDRAPRADLASDPFIQAATAAENWAPGGRFAAPSFPDRGPVIERSGSVSTALRHQQTLGNFKLQSGDIEGRLGFVVDLSDHHPHEVHSPFDVTARTSDSDRQNAPDGTQSSYDMAWEGLFVHPANGYDPPSGGGFPAPDPRGAIDIISYSITGTATGVYPLTQQEIQRRDVARRQAFDDRVDRIRKHFADAGDAFRDARGRDTGGDGHDPGDPFSRVDFRRDDRPAAVRHAGQRAWSGTRGAWSVVKGAVDTLDFLSDYSSRNRGLVSVARQGGPTAFRRLDIRAQYQALAFHQAVYDLGNRISRPIADTIEAIHRDLHARYPEATEFVVSEGGYVIALIPGIGGKAGRLGRKVVGKLDLDLGIHKPGGKKTTTIGERRAHHNRIVAELKAELKKQGYRVSDREISFGSACGGKMSCRPDIVYQAPDGTYYIIEVKTGNADLTRHRQRPIFPQIEAGTAIPRGPFAKKFDLETDVPLSVTQPDGIRIEIRRFPGIEQ